MEIPIKFNLKGLKLAPLEKDVYISTQKNSKAIAKTIDRSGEFTKIGINIDVGQGCIYAGNAGEILKSSGFDTCAPFIVMPKQGGKRILGHIDSQSTAQEIVDKVTKELTPQEIQEASYHYFKGAETFNSQQKLGGFAIKTIEDALSRLGVKGNYEGALKSGFEDIIVNPSSVKIIDDSTVLKHIKF